MPRSLILGRGTSVNEKNDTGNILEQHLSLSFCDGTSWSFNAAFLLDALPVQQAKDNFRKCDSGGFDLLRHPSTRVLSAKSTTEGDRLLFEWSEPTGKGTGSTEAQCFTASIPSCWLRAQAAAFASPLNEGARAARAADFDSVQKLTEGGRGAWGLAEARGLGVKGQIPWEGKDFTKVCEVFQVDDILENPSQHIRFLETIATYGFAWLDEIPPPPAEDRGREGEVDVEMMKVVKRVVGRAWPHPSRGKDHWALYSHKDPTVSAVANQDYDTTKPLALHTDQCTYENGNYLMWFFQPFGVTVPHLVDGLAVVYDFAKTQPEYFKILAETPVAHASFHTLYSVDGRVTDRGADRDLTPLEVDLFVNEPTIGLWMDAESALEEIRKGNPSGVPILRKLRFREHKRAFLPPEVVAGQPGLMKEFMDAYESFEKLLNDNRFACPDTVIYPEGRALVFNNQRLVHTRPRKVMKARTTVGCCNTKERANQAYRLARMRRTAAALGLGSEWTSRLLEPSLEKLYQLGLEAEKENERGASQRDGPGVLKAVCVGGEGTFES